MAKKQKKEKGVLAQTLENYWYYYKWPTIGGIVIFFVVLVVMTNLSQPANTSADVTVLSVYARPLTTKEYEFQSRLENTVSDVDGNGTGQIALNALYITEKGDSDNDMVSKGKLDGILAYAQGDLVLLDGANKARLLSKDFLAPLTDYSIDLTSVAKEDIVYRNDIPVAVRLRDSRILLDMGFIVDDVYAGIMFTPDEKTEQTVAQRENAAKMITELVKK